MYKQKYQEMLAAVKKHEEELKDLEAQKRSKRDQIKTLEDQIEQGKKDAKDLEAALAAKRKECQDWEVVKQVPELATVRLDRSSDLQCLFMPRVSLLPESHQGYTSA